MMVTKIVLLDAVVNFSIVKVDGLVGNASSQILHGERSLGYRSNLSNLYRSLNSSVNLAIAIVVDQLDLRSSNGRGNNSLVSCISQGAQGNCIGILVDVVYQSSIQAVAIGSNL